MSVELSQLYEYKWQPVKKVSTAVEAMLDT